MGAGRVARSPLPDSLVPVTVDRTDWLKTAAIVFVSVDHFGYFFMEDDLWWAAFGRLAAPVFFFLLGYARNRTVPLRWIWLGITLTLLDSWNDDGTWVAPNILLSLALIRAGRPFVHRLLHQKGWVALALLVIGLIAGLPMTADLVDYGTEGWLWALLGLCRRIHVDGKRGADEDSRSPEATTAGLNPTTDAGLMSLLTCLVAAAVYVWQEQLEFSFSQVQLAVVILGIAILSLILLSFRRGPSRIRPPKALAVALRFMGRHTLEIYAIQLAGSELLVGLVPALAPDLDELQGWMRLGATFRTVAQ